MREQYRLAWFDLLSGRHGHSELRVEPTVAMLLLDHARKHIPSRYVWLEKC